MNNVIVQAQNNVAHNFSVFNIFSGLNCAGLLWRGRSRSFFRGFPPRSSHSRTSANVKQTERMSMGVRQTCASHSLSWRLSVSTSGSVLLMSLVELCSFPNKGIDKHLVWAALASVQHEALLPTRLCGFPSFLSLAAQPTHVLIVAVWMMIIPHQQHALAFVYRFFYHFLHIYFKSVCTWVYINCAIVKSRIACIPFISTGLV